MSNPNQKAWRLVRAHARMHRTMDDCSTHHCHQPAVVMYVAHPGPQQSWGDKKRPVCQECMDALVRGKGRGMFEDPKEPGFLFYSYADREAIRAMRSNT